MTKRSLDLPLDEAAIRAWAYDVELALADQDEDLMLGARHEFYPLLATLAKDAACPRADECLAIMDFNLMFRVLRAFPDTEAEVEKTIGYLLDSDRSPVAAFIHVNRLRLDLLRGGSVASEERALELGTAALNGISRQAEIAVTDAGSYWVIELSVPPLHLHKEWLTIDKATGGYTFRR